MKYLQYDINSPRPKLNAGKQVRQETPVPYDGEMDWQKSRWIEEILARLRAKVAKR